MYCRSSLLLRYLYFAYLLISSSPAIVTPCFYQCLLYTLGGPVLGFIDCTLYSLIFCGIGIFSRLLNIFVDSR